MVDYAVAHYGSDTHRVFITGLSAGGAMTADMLADYPDVFAGGATDSGLPAFCATSTSQASTCQYSNQNKTPAQWGTLARGGDSGYAGPWPRVAIWQGSSDSEVTPVNSTELRDQWTNVWGISQTASSTQTLTGGTTLNVYNDSSGKPAVELYTDLRHGPRHGGAPGFGDRPVRHDRHVLPELHLLDVLHREILRPGHRQRVAVAHTDADGDTHPDAYSHAHANDAGLLHRE